MLREGTLSISPLEESQIQPASVDIRLGNMFSIIEDLPTGVIEYVGGGFYRVRKGNL